MDTPGYPSNFNDLNINKKMQDQIKELKSVIAVYESAKPENHADKNLSDEINKALLAERVEQLKEV